MVVKTFYVWVNALTSGYAEAVAGRLVRRAWQVGALGRQLILNHEDKPSTLIAFSMMKNPKDGEELTHTHAMDEVCDVLKVLKVSYYSIVVTEATVCTWSLGNLSMSEAAKQDEAQRKGMN